MVAFGFVVQWKELSTEQKAVFEDLAKDAKLKQLQQFLMGALVIIIEEKDQGRSTSSITDVQMWLLHSDCFALCSWNKCMQI